MVEKLIVRIIDKAKSEGDHDYVISEAKVRQDLREVGELTPDVELAMSEAANFLHELLSYPVTQKIFFAEKFETKTVADYKQLFKKELEDRRKQ